MSWFKKALAISILGDDAYYIVTDPIQFYEWKWTGYIPKGIKASKNLPSSDVFTDGLIVINADIPAKYLEDGKLSCDVHTTLHMKLGQIQSPAELLQKYIDLDAEFKRQLDNFKKNSLSQKYVVSTNKKPHLYRITAKDDNAVILENFGKLTEIGEKASLARNILNHLSHEKMGRSYEWEDARNMENLLTFMGNKGLQLDGVKLDRLVSTAKLQPEQHREMNWIDCYAALHDEAAETRDKMRKFKSLQWVRGMG